MGDRCMAITTDAFEIDGFVQQRKELEALLMSNPQMEKKVQGLIRKVLMQARKQIGDAAKQPNVMKSDPRQAYKAVKTAVYRQILGGNVSLYRKKRASKTGGDYTPITTIQPGQRGGNRRPRGGRTKQLQSYMGSDRGFVLRFLEAGTPGNRNLRGFRYDESREHVHRGSQGGNIRKYGKTINTGYRGHISARNFFGTSSQQAMEQAAQQLTQYIDELIKQKIYNV